MHESILAVTTPRATPTQKIGSKGGELFYQFYRVGMGRDQKNEEEVQKKRKKLELENSNKNEPLFV